MASSPGRAVVQGWLHLRCPVDQRDHYFRLVGDRLRTGVSPRSLTMNQKGFYVINEDETGDADFFPNLEEAIDDAKRQAGDNPENTFLVLQPVVSVVSPPSEPVVTQLLDPQEAGQ